MAGDWIKIQHATPDKPEMDQLANILNIDVDAVVGKCLRLWIWADQQSVDGNALTVTNALLDRVTHCPGFAIALRKVGWLEGREGRLSIPNFSRHNGQTAKNRALGGDRVKRKRNASSVTKALPEKRREEKSNSNKSTCSSRFQAPSLEQVTEYCQEKGYTWDPEHFIDHYTANSWKQSNGNSIKDWKAAARNWNRNHKKFGDQSSGKQSGRRARVSAAQQREQTNADAFAAVFGSGEAADGAVLDEESGSVHSPPAGYLGSSSGDVPG